MENASNGDLFVKCLICGKRLPDGTLQPACAEHLTNGEWQEYIMDMVEARDAAALEAGAPIDYSALDWRVHHVEGDWRLLKVNRGRVTQSTDSGAGEGLTTDWRAENAITGEVRTFPQSAELDVWFDLLGIRPFDRALHEERMKEAASNQAQSRQRARQMIRMLREPRGDVAREVFGDMFEADGTPKAPQIELAEHVKGVHIPVYGPAGKPFGLELSSTRLHNTPTGGVRSQTGSVTFEFANRPATNEDPARTEEYLIEVRNRLLQERAANGLIHGRAGNVQGISWIGSDAGQLEGLRKEPRQLPTVPTKAVTIGSLCNLTYATPGALSLQTSSYGPFDDYASRLYDGLDNQVRGQLPQLECEELCEQASGFLWSFAPDLIDEIAASGSRAELVQRQFVLEGTEFGGTMLYWPGPEVEGKIYSLCGFRLEHLIQSPILHCVVGGTFGISQEENISLLEQLVAVNDRAALIAEYQTQLDEHLKRWRS